MPHISLEPMLRIQRDLYDIPRGPERFRRYLGVMTGGSGDMVLPLSVFNPMGKDAVRDRLDALIALDAEPLAARAIEEVVRRLADVDASFRVGLALADDAGGGWTNRHHTEVGNYFRPTPILRRGWAVALCWTSELPTAGSVRREVLATIYRNAFLLSRGEPRTLREMMIQEGLAAVFAGRTAAGLEPEEIEYTREVIRPHLDATDLATVIPCLFGDRAARALGNDPAGLSDRAGLTLATAEALAGSLSPEKALRNREMP